MANPKLQAAVDRFVADIEHLIRNAALAAVQDALGGGSAPAAAPKARAAAKAPKAAKAAKAATPKSAPKAAAKAAPKASAKPAKGKAGKRARRTPEDLARDVKAVVGWIAANPKSSAEQIKKALHIEDKHWGLTITKALESGQVKSTGQKRATRYTAK